ncbi:MAG TPA: Bax inhibitor-1/YccA family protein [Tetragenococcus sp.]|nr:Bax inhibitor-1/YccA family protein [Tetragenococcus sp.]
MNNHQVIEETSGLNLFYAKVYGIFGLGIGISALAAYLSMNIFMTQTLNFLSRFPLGLTGIWLVEIGLVILLSAKAQKNPSLTLAGFIVYSLLNGLVLSLTLSFYTQATVGRAFVSAMVTFIGMSIYGVFTKRDLTGIGRAGIGLLWGVIIATLINLFLQSSGVDYFLSYATVLIFVGLTAYDNQQIRNMYFATVGQDNLGIAAFMALQLYLDFINLFLSLLRIFSRD